MDHFFSVQFQQLGGDSKILNESNKPGYEETLKSEAVTSAPIDDEEPVSNDIDLNSPSEMILSKIDDSKHFNDTFKVSLKKWFSNIFSKLHL